MTVLASTPTRGFTVKEQIKALHDCLSENGTSLLELLHARRDVIVLKKALQKALRKEKDVAERVALAMNDIRPPMDSDSQ